MTEQYCKRARDLLSQMTLDEKVSQMLHASPAIKRLGIPAYNWWGEALHGVGRAGVATSFPQAIGMAATFDPALLQQVADVISTECRAKFHEFQRQNDTGRYKGLTMWTPNINIFRDPRWGRGQETYGEDPYLTAQLGCAFVKGLQGDNPQYLKTAACAKHYVVHSGPEHCRHWFDAKATPKDFYETYLPAFRALIQQAHVESVMGAYNRTNGEPCCGSPTLLVNLLRGELGFRGHVVSDCGAIKDFHEQHKVTQNGVESAALAVKCGCDLNCGTMYAYLLTAVEKGLLTEADIDACVLRLLTTRMKLGLFDPPEQVPYAQIPYRANNCKQHNDFAVEVARRSMVLLKNKNNLLPLNEKSIKTLAVIGHNANNRRALVGNYEGTASRYITVLEGLQDYLQDRVEIIYAQGCDLFRDGYIDQYTRNPMESEAISAAQAADAVVVCLGLDGTIEGEQMDAYNGYGSGDKKDLSLPGQQEALLKSVAATGKPVILVMMSGSCIAMDWADANIDAIVQAWYPGAQGGKAVAELLFGQYAPSGKLPVTFYSKHNTLPDFEDYAMRGRTYRYLTQAPLYPFGYGLSYTRVALENLTKDKSSIAPGEDVSFSFTAKNTGSYAITESITLYYRAGSNLPEQPCHSLKGLCTVTLQPGEAKQCSITLHAEDMQLVTPDGQFIYPSGIQTVFIGRCQPDERSIALTGDTPLKTTFQIQE